MQYSSAKAAGPIVAAIDQATAGMTAIGNQTSANARIVSIQWTNANGSTYDVTGIELTTAESANIFKHRLVDVERAPKRCQFPTRGHYLILPHAECGKTDRDTTMSVKCTALMLAALVISSPVHAADNATALRVWLLTVRVFEPTFDAYYTGTSWRWFGHPRGRYEFEKCLRGMGITFERTY